MGQTDEFAASSLIVRQAASCGFKLATAMKDVVSENYGLVVQGFSLRSHLCTFST